MTQKQPSWKRKGYETREQYAAACRANKKTQAAALLATKTRNKAKDILRILWENAEFDKPQVKITRQNIMAEASCHLDTVKDALRQLKAEGSIVQLNPNGGRHVPGHYRLRVAGHDTTPSEEHVEAMKTRKDRDAAFRYMSAKFGPLRALEILGDPPEQD